MSFFGRFRRRSRSRSRSSSTSTSSSRSSSRSTSTSTSTSSTTSTNSTGRSSRGSATSRMGAPHSEESDRAFAAALQREELGNLMGQVFGAGGPVQGGMSSIFSGLNQNAFFRAPQQEQEEEDRGPPPASLRVLANLREECLDLSDIEAGNSSCTICFETQRVGDLAIRLKCGHAFHKACVMPWLRAHCTCPVCRYELPTDNAAFGARSDDKTQEERERERYQNARERERADAERRLAEQRERMARMDAEERQQRRRRPPQDSTAAGGDAGNSGNGSGSAGGSGSASASGSARTSDSASGSAASASTPTNAALSVREMKRQLKLLGVDFRTAVEKKDLRELLRAATDRAQLHALSISELHRRMTHMGISKAAINSASEKSQLTDLLLEAIRREGL